MTGTRARLLEPLPITRAASTLPGVAILAVLLALPQVQRGAAQVALVLGAAAVSAWFAIRGYRMAVICTEDALVVRGLFRSRTIARSAIERITSTPRVHWRDAHRRRRTLIMAFVSLNNTAAPVWARNQQAIAYLQQWLTDHPQQT